jgi:hypothetical protein
MLIDDGLLPSLAEDGRRNWAKWRDVFEHGTPVRTNPLLTDPTRFGDFCKEYSVGRTIRGGTRNEFRIELCAPSFSDAIRDDSGQAIDSFEECMRTRFGTVRTRIGMHDDKPGRLVSVLSKVAAFVRPERFVAWDTYAKRGVNLTRNCAASRQFGSYAGYLEEFDKIWNGQIGQEIRDHAARTGAHGIETEPRFLRRVLDVYLMKRGGRWSG